jgi:hypothetical protein
MIRIFRKRQLKKKACRLVGTARVVAVSATTSLVDGLPAMNRFLKMRGDEGIASLDLCMMVACVGVGLMTADVDQRYASEFFLETMAALNKVDSNAPRMLSSFLEDSVKGISKPAEALQPIGFWILRQLDFGDSAAISKADISALGGIVLGNMASWD